MKKDILKSMYKKNQILKLEAKNRMTEAGKKASVVRESKRTKSDGNIEWKDDLDNVLGWLEILKRRCINEKVTPKNVREKRKTKTTEV